MTCVTSDTKLWDLPSDCILLIGQWLPERTALDMLYSVTQSMRRECLPAYLAMAYGVEHSHWTRYAAQMRALATTFWYAAPCHRQCPSIRHCVLHGLSVALAVLVQHYVRETTATTIRFNRQVNQWFSAAIVTGIQADQLTVLGRYMSAPRAVIDWPALTGRACRLYRPHAIEQLLQLWPDCVNYITASFFKKLGIEHHVLLLRRIFFSPATTDEHRAGLLRDNLVIKDVAAVVSDYMFEHPCSTLVDAYRLSTHDSGSITRFAKLINLDPLQLELKVFIWYMNACDATELALLLGRARIRGDTDAVIRITQRIEDVKALTVLDQEIFELI